MKHQVVVSTALVAALAVASHAHVQAGGGKEKCYGIAKAGQNDCGNLAGTHSCAGLSTVDNDPGEWKLVAKGTCKELGGMTKKEAVKKHKASKK